MERLSRSYTCVLFDHRGHGQSDHPASIAANHIDRYADDVAALVGHLGHRRVSFFGWSNGVAVGLKVAQEHPQMFDSLVLFGAIGRRADTEQLRRLNAQRLPVMRDKGWWTILEPMKAAEKFPVPQWFFDRVLATDTAPWIAYTESRPDSNWSPWDAMPLITSPALLLAGELEDPDDILAEAASTMPDARRIRVPDREHINAFLYSEFVVPPVLEFLARSVSVQPG